MLKQIKAIAGATAAGLGSAGAAFVVVPPEVVMPWYGYVAVGVINAALTYLAVYWPKNAE
jgi:hypothetical protein